MEQEIWSHNEHILNLPTSSQDKPLLLQTLASVRSLIINPSTSDSTVSIVIETLTRYLQIHNDSLVLRHILKLLRDIAFHRTHFAHLVFNSVRVKAFLFSESTRLAAETLSLLVSVSEMDSGLVSSMDEFGESFFVSLCFRPHVAVRSWLLMNADRFPIRPYLLFTVLLGFTKDPYPHVRRIALEGLVKLSTSVVCEDIGVIEGCYCRAIELLQDSEDRVRSTAVRAVCGWWKLLVASNEDKVKVDGSDALFVKKLAAQSLIMIESQLIIEIDDPERGAQAALEWCVGKKEANFLKIIHTSTGLESFPVSSISFKLDDHTVSFPFSFDTQRHEETLHASNILSIYTMLCSLVRDMSVEVRVVALDALGMMEMVSDDNMLQSLSKKVLGVTKEKRSLHKCTMELFGISAADGAGAFVHGLEDEFHEVRLAACRSLQMLKIISAEFSGQVLNLVMDMLNDDSMAVQLEALAVMHHMANNNCLNVQEMHMHMFLGVLVDSDTLTRTAARKIVLKMKLPNLHVFKSFLDGLIKILEIHPQDEYDVFHVLFQIGQRHGNFAVSVIKEFYEQIEPPFNSQLRSNSPRIAAFLVLAIAAPLAHDQQDWSIPPKIFTYTLTMLGRISHGLQHIMDQSTLLTYLSWCRKSTRSAPEMEERGPFLKAMRISISDSARIENCISSTMLPGQISDGPSESDIQIMSKAGEDTHCKLLEYIKFIFAKVKDTWPLIQSGYMQEVLRTLRIYKDGLTAFTSDSIKNTGALAFTLQYLRIVKILTKVWVNLFPKGNPRYHAKGELDFVLGKLDNCLREMKYRFTRLTEEEELHVLEVTLLTYILKLAETSKCEICYTMKKLSTTVSRIELLHREGFSEPSNFFTELKKLLYKNESFGYEASCNTLLLPTIQQFFSLKQFGFCGRRLRYLWAKLEIPGNDSLDPLAFVSGLPVAIPCNITLYNVSCKNKLWVKMTVDDVKFQFVYLDLNQFGNVNEVKKFTYLVPFYNTPKATAFSLRLSIVMECPVENVGLAKGIRRPKNELTYLCKDVEAFLSLG